MLWAKGSTAFISEHDSDGEINVDFINGKVQVESV